MASSHPYISGAGNITAMVEHLRKSFPATVDAETVKKLGLAPNNESYVINALQFIGIIDAECKKVETAGKVFSLHKDEDFAKEFKEIIKAAYHALFELHGDSAWSLSKDDLITFFRQSDQTSEAIGKRQAATFQVFAAQSGYGEIINKKLSESPARAAPAKKANKPKNVSKEQNTRREFPNPNLSGRNISVGEFGLSVKVDINLPSNATAETYDNIFKSIRKNLIDDR